MDGNNIYPTPARVLALPGASPAAALPTGSRNALEASLEASSYHPSLDSPPRDCRPGIAYSFDHSEAQKRRLRSKATQ